MLPRQCKTKTDIPVQVFDTIRTVITANQYGDTIYAAETKVIQEQIKELKQMAKLLAKKDSALLILANSINKNTQNATYYNSVTNVYANTDTVLIDSTGAYTANLTNRWYEAKMRMSKDSAELNISFDNPFTVQHKRVKKNLFSNPELIVEVKPINPFSRITELKSFSIPDKKHNIGLYATLNVGNLYSSLGVDLRYNYKRIGASLQAGYSTIGPYYSAGAQYRILTK